VAINFSFSATGTSRFAQVIGQQGSRFLIGKEVVYDKVFHGLANESVSAGNIYDPKAFVGQHGFWAYFIMPTAKGESNYSFLCLNSYDRAQFTFGFMQYAAHVPNGDFVVFLKRLLALPDAGEYFPKLVLQNNRIFYRGSTGALSQLENDVSSQALMNYLNPSLNDVEGQELICAARMVHWATNDPSNRTLQVQLAIDNFKQYMHLYSKRFNLDGFPDRVCQMVCDIKHQGRARDQAIVDALNTNGNFDLAFSRLQQLGKPKYGNRISAVSSVITKLVAAGIFGKKYDAVQNDFA